MRVLLACEANDSVGTGHVTRCYALAQALDRRGIQCVISGEIEGPEWLIQLIQPFFASPDSVRSESIDMVIIDSYVTELFDRVTLAHYLTPQVHIVDDSTPVRSAIGYIEPGVNNRWSPSLECRDVPHFGGPESVLIRDELRRSSTTSDIPRSPDPLRVVVSLGGGDGYGLRQNLLDALIAVTVPLNIVMLAPEPLTHPSGIGTKVRFVTPGAAINSELTTADVVISAAGVSSWEMLHKGIPTGLICAVDNQRANYRFMTQEQLVVGLGDLSIGQDLDSLAMAHLLTDADLRQGLATRASSLIDGQGADRAADMIIGILTDLDIQREGRAP